MTKAEIINKIAEQTGVAKKDVAMTVEAFMEEIRVSLAENKENVYLRSRLPLIQAGQELYRENEVINILIKF